MPDPLKYVLVSLNLAPRPEMGCHFAASRVVNRKEGDEKGTSDGTQIAELRNPVAHLAPLGTRVGAHFRKLIRSQSSFC